MKRILKAIAIVISVWLSMGILAWLIVDVIGWQIPEWVVTILSYLFGWPLLLLNPLIPASVNPNPNAFLVRNLLYVLAVILDLTLYSLLAYAVLRWRGGKRISN